MQDVTQLPELKVPKWPFFVADAIMLGLAYYLFYFQVPAGVALKSWEVLGCCVCVTLAAGLGVLPYLLEYRALVKHSALLRLIDSNALMAAAEKITNLESCVTRIDAATDHLQSAQSQADKTAALAQQITDRMAQEVKEFSEFMQRAGDGEKATLRLEAEKLRRGEAEWLQVLVFMLDHIFALNKAAERSGQENLIKQLGHFQAVCRDAARRVGLVAIAPARGDAFEAQRHQVAEGETPTAGLINDVLSSGFSFQGKVIRPAVVSLEKKAESAASLPAASGSQLPLGGGLVAEA